MDTRTRRIRRLFRLISRVLMRLLTRTTITGREHLDTPGPALYVANHASTYDALLLITLLPPDTVFVGPGDFKLRWPGDWVVRHVGLIPMKRGAVDREGLKRMLDVLKAGGRLAIFPEGGTWEKPLDDVKSGAAYLSHSAGARLVPMGFGGTYQAWRQIFRLRRPRITVTIGAPLPAVTVSGDRKRRQDELQAASVRLMRHIYTLLPPDTQARYDQLARQQFSGRLEIDPPALPVPAVPLDALAELVSKPNLFSPLRHNLKLPVAPFVRPGQFFAPQVMQTAAEALLTAFSPGGALPDFLEYRLGEAKAAQVRAALAAIQALMPQVAAAGARVAFVPQVTETSPPA